MKAKFFKGKEEHKMVYNLKLNKKDIEILVTALNAAPIDKSIVEELSQYVLEQKESQDKQENEGI